MSRSRLVPLTLMIVALAHAAPAGAANAPANPPASPSPEQQARKLYGDGEAAFTAGRYLDAVKSFEAAYQLIHKVKLLWNIAHAWRRQYTISFDVADLRRAAAVLRNYRELTDSEVERKESDEALVEVEQIIQAQEARAQPQVAVVAIPSPATSGRSDRARTFQVTGIVLGVAGVALLGGGVAFTALGQKAFKDLNEPPPGTVFDQQTLDRFHLFRATGYSMLGLGVAALGAGVGLLTVGLREGRPATVTVVPSLGAGGGGLVAAGVF